MDLHNNVVGREIGRRVSTEDDAKQRCQDAVTSGELQVIGEVNLDSDSFLTERRQYRYESCKES